MFDAQSVRKAAGEQAKLLNQIIDELLNNHIFSERKLKELLGHSDLSSTQIYTHVNIEQMKKAFRKAHPHAK